jgi:pSer/pThr/pTyr-binding forkhead associated (FHA) protein
VGRGADAGVRIDSRELSRVHAAITVSATDVLIEDLGSTNGTTVNGVAHQGPCRLVAGDRVAFGTIELVVEILPEGTQ